ncbi:MAG: hypothetical protein A2Y15_03535 [Clostridiales bacterium GWF2_36_10]|nr:MAG: hypothetical protein A2Y15_03535 [Clostridiales bacterium GWF2_36_10]HAN20304.1 hypothetical protein [Clostridiales bacterium]
MFKKISMLVIIFTLISTFVSCNGDNDNSDTSKEDTSSTVSVVSETSSQEISEEVSTESSEEVSEEVSTGVVEGIYYGDGYSFTIPEGFSFITTFEGMGMFANEDMNSFIATSFVGTESAVEVYTQEIFETEFAAYIEDCEITSFEAAEIEGLDAYSIKYTDEGHEIVQYVVLTSNKHYTIGFGITEENAEEIITSTMSSFTIEE